MVSQTEVVLSEMREGCTTDIDAHFERMPKNFTEMRYCHNKVVDVVRRTIEDHMATRLHSAIGDNTTVQDYGLSDEVRRLRPDLKFVASTFTNGGHFTVLVDVSCSYGRIYYGENTLKKVFVDKLEKCRRLAHELEASRDMRVEIILVIVSSLGAVNPESLEALRTLLFYGDKGMRKIGRQLSEAVITGSFRIWRGYARNMNHGEDPRIGRIAEQEAVIADEELKTG
jgi:hypothetical protein